MARSRLATWTLLTCLLAAGCAGPTTAPTGTTTKRGGSTSTPAGTSGDTTPPATTTTPPAAAFGGQVLGLDGLPAAGVQVRGYLVSNNGGGLVGNNSGSYHVLADAGLSATTDAQGRFTLTPPPDGQTLTIEAVQKDDVKAIKLGVAKASEAVTLKLAPTGTLSGKVTAPQAPTVTNFQGVDVYIPGTSYSAKTDAAGNFTISQVPAGTFTLVATKQGLGNAERKDVTINSNATTTVEALALSVTAPAIHTITPANAGPGTTLTLKGDRFGATAGLPFEVTIGGVVGLNPTRVDNQTLTVTVPDTAGSSGLVIKVDTIASQPAAFQVIKELALKAPTRYLVKGRTQAYTVSAKDTAGNAVANPSVSWSVTHPANAPIALSVADGTVTALAVGDGTLKVAAGQVSDSVGLAVVGSEAELPADETLSNVSGLAITSAGAFVTSGDTLYKLSDNGATSPLIGATGPDVVSPYMSLEFLVADASGTLYCNDDTRLLKITPDGTVTNLAGVTPSSTSRDGTGAAARFYIISALALGPDNNLYVIDDAPGGSKLRRITPLGEVTTLPGQGFYASAMLALPNGKLVINNRTLITLWDTAAARETILAGDGQGAESRDGQGEDADFSDITAMALGPDGAIYVGDGDLLRRVALDGTVTTIANPVGAPLQAIGALAFDAQGKLHLIDTDQGKAFTVTLPQP